MATPHGSFAWSLKDKAGKFFEKLYDYSPDKLSSWIEKNCENDFMYIEFGYQQLGHKNPDEWFESQRKALNFNTAKIRREILLQWNSSVSNSPFPEEDMRELTFMKKRFIDDVNISFIINGYYRLNVYKQLNPSKKYLIGVDPAKGRGDKADNSAVVVVEAETNETAAVFKSNTIQYKELYRFIYTLVNKHIPNSVIIVENNVDTLIEYLKDSPLKHQLYFDFATDHTKDKRSNGYIKPKDKNTMVYGITTTSKNRPKYFDILFEYVHSAPERVCAEELLDEIERLEYKNQERIQACSGCHDDVIMAYLLTQYVVHYGTNKARFGLFNVSALNIDENIQRTRTVFDDGVLFRPKKKEKIYSDPFFANLLVKPDTLEELEARWSKERYNIIKNGSQDEDLYGDVSGFSIFEGRKDDTGIRTAASNTFELLNSNLKMVDMWGSDPDSNCSLDFMRDENIGGW